MGKLSKSGLEPIIRRCKTSLECSLATYHSMHLRHTMSRSQNKAAAKNYHEYDDVTVTVACGGLETVTVIVVGAGQAELLELVEVVVVVLTS